MDVQIVLNEFKYTKAINMIYAAKYNIEKDEGKNRKNKLRKYTKIKLVKHCRY